MCNEANIDLFLSLEQKIIVSGLPTKDCNQWMQWVGCCALCPTGHLRVGTSMENRFVDMLRNVFSTLLLDYLCNKQICIMDIYHILKYLVMVFWRNISGIWRNVCIIKWPVGQRAQQPTHCVHWLQSFVWSPLTTIFCSRERNRSGFTSLHTMNR